MVKMSLGSVDLSQDEIDWWDVITELSGAALRTQVAVALKGHLIRFKPQYNKQLNYLARRHGLTYEEVFRRLKCKEDLGAIVDDAPILQSEEDTSFGCEVKKSD